MSGLNRGGSRGLRRDGEGPAAKRGGPYGRGSAPAAPNRRGKSKTETGRRAPFPPSDRRPAPPPAHPAPHGRHFASPVRRAVARLAPRHAADARRRSAPGDAHRCAGRAAPPAAPAPGGCGSTRVKRVHREHERGDRGRGQQAGLARGRGFWAGRAPPPAGRRVAQGAGEPHRKLHARAGLCGRWGERAVFRSKNTVVPYFFSFTPPAPAN